MKEKPVENIAGALKPWPWGSITYAYITRVWGWITGVQFILEYILEYLHKFALLPLSLLFQNYLYLNRYYVNFPALNTLLINYT
jgi:hypothetical protein